MAIAEIVISCYNQIVKDGKVDKVRYGRVRTCGIYGRNALQDMDETSMQDSRRTDGEVRMTGTPRAGQRTRCKGGFALNTAATRKESVLNSARARRRVCNRIWRNRYIYLMVIPVLIYMLLL